MEPPGGKTADAPAWKAAELPEPGAEATDAVSRDPGAAAEPATADHEAEEGEAAPSPWSIPLTISDLGDFDDDDWQPGELPAWANEPDEVIDDEEAAAAVADPGAPGSGEDVGGEAAASLVTDGGTATAQGQSSGAHAPSGDAHPDAVTPDDIARPGQNESDVARTGESGPDESGPDESGPDVAGAGEATPDEAGHDDVPDKPGPDGPGLVLAGGGQAEAAGAAADMAEADLAAADGTTSQAGAVTGATEEAAGDQAGGEGGASPGDATGGSAGTLGDEVAIVPGVARYHRPDCILIRFLGDGDLESATRQQAEARGCVPCKACEPGKAAQDSS